MKFPIRLFAGVLTLTPVIALKAQETVPLRRSDGQPLQVKAYTPKHAGCRGIALVSPGAGGTEDGYTYLGQALSKQGYLAIVMGHRESGPSALRAHVHGHTLREGLAGLITDPAAYQGRSMDIAATMTWGKGRCDSAQAILVGHSMGAATVMIEAGARNNLGLRGGDGFAAYIAISPQGPGSIFPAHAWSNIQKPFLSITGTRDHELGGASWQSRTVPHADMPAGCKWLAVVEGASHMNLAGRAMSLQAERATQSVMASFLESLSRGDCREPGPRAVTPNVTLRVK
ncbi:MAG: alpha/beta hydrolase family protein [Limnohabitans sp.]